MKNTLLVLLVIAVVLIFNVESRRGDKPRKGSKPEKGIGRPKKQGKPKRQQSYQSQIFSRVHILVALLLFDLDLI